MATVSQVLERMQKLQANFDAAVVNIIKDTSNQIIVLDQLQLQDGTDSTGNKIKPEYKRPDYSKKKAAQNPAPGFGVPDLRLSGAMYRGMQVVVNNDTFELTSVVDYYPKLVSQYGDNPFKLSDKSKSQYAQTVFYESLKRYVSDTTQLL